MKDSAIAKGSSGVGRPTDAGTAVKATESPASRPPTGGEMVIKCLERESVEYIFGLSGGAAMPLFDALFCETNPIPVKAAVSLMGKAGDEIRLPLTPLGDAKRDRLQRVMKDAGLL